MFSRKQNACYKHCVNLNYSDKNHPCLNNLKVLPVTNIMPQIHFSDYDSFVLLLWPDQPDRYNLTPPTTGTNTHLSVITNYYLHQLLTPTKLVMVVTWSARSPVQLPRAVPSRSKSRAVAPLHYTNISPDGQLLVFYMMLLCSIGFFCRRFNFCCHWSCLVLPWRKQETHSLQSFDEQSVSVDSKWPFKM